MKKRLIQTALVTVATAIFSACDEKPAATTPTDAGSTDTATEQQSAQAGQQEQTAPTNEQIVAAVEAHLTDYPWLSVALDTMETAQNADGSTQVNAKLKLTTKEGLYESQNAPAAFNEERKAMNASANAAMQPNSLYLLQISAPTEAITDEDRAARPLPENLQQMANELRDLAESAVYVEKIAAGTVYEVTATMTAVKTENGMNCTDVTMQTDALPTPGTVLPVANIPEGTNVLTAEFEEARKNEIRSKIAAFDAAAAPYIKSREDEARTKWTEYLAKKEEEARKAAEVATAAAAEKEQWINHCISTVAVSKQFKGEWVRGSDFGKITLEISRVYKYENSVQFVGVLFDTEMPDSRMDISGRCDYTKAEDGTSRVDVTIYDGYYQDDKPTAEVYLADDGIMQLQLDAKGNLFGIMTCQSWKNQPEKAFKITLSAPAK